MPGWLTRIPERTRGSGDLAAWVEPRRPAYLVLDRRRYPEACAELLGQAGQRDFMTLFATTPLAPLIEASPWLVELEVGSEAWLSGEALCREQRLGWAFQPAPATPLTDLADHLRRFFVLDDPHGGQSLVNIQDPAAWTALLTAGSDTTYAQLIGPLGRVVTPTPQRHWLAWQPADSLGNADALPLTQELELALKESPRAWWISQATETPLPALPPEWLERLICLAAGGITHGRDRTRLLPLICQASDATWRDAQAILVDPSLTAVQKTGELERLS
ncbi:DUF4123 domain-containing protein [Halomonas salifodinae]|uniref:DUF4123 domain-containing protein n=1 Tax=Halomonas salifodinae TaxID=438745 RepID=UPI0033B9EC3C